MDDKALEKIEGSTIDFTEDLIGSKYVFLLSKVGFVC